METFSGIWIDGRWHYQPQEKQQAFHNAILNRAENGVRDFLFGGAARGGKSYAMRWEAHRNCLSYPRLRGLLIRSSFPELERSHLRDLPFDLPSDICSYNSQKHVATYNNESSLEFGYGERREDFRQYLSAEYDFILIDELTTIPFEFSYLLRSRLSASRKEFIPFWATASNPGDIAHVDVRNYFVTKAVLDKERFPAYNPKEVLFIPATVYDNKILLSRDPGELKRLQQLSKRDQQRFLFGNWDIFEGQFFSEFFADVHVVRKENYLSYEQLLAFNARAGMDYGNFSACEWMVRDYHGNVIVFDEWTDVKSVRSKKIDAVKKFITDRKLGQVQIEADTNMWSPDTFDKAYQSDPATDFIAAGIPLAKVSKTTTGASGNRNYRISCNDAISNALHWEAAEDGSILIKPKVVIYERCVKLVETLPMLIVSKNDQEDIADQGDLDTWFDACVAGHSLVATVNGDIPIKELVGKEGHCYSYRFDKKRIGATKFHSVRSKGVQHTYRVIFDNGAYLETTADHLLLTKRRMKSGTELTWTRADKLRQGQSIMPLYKNTLANGYLRIATQDKSVEMRAHRMIYEDITGGIPEGFEIHHRNKNKLDNSPGNLQALTPQEHQSMHSKERWENNPGLRERARHHMNEVMRPKAIEWHKSDAARAFHVEHGRRIAKKLYSENSPRVAKECTVCGEPFSSYKAMENRRLYCSNKCNLKAQRLNPDNQVVIQCLRCGKPHSIFRGDANKTKYCSKSCGHQGIFNHRVASVEHIGEQEVFDLTTDAENFAVNGVIVHNCKMGFMPLYTTREPVQEEEQYADFNTYINARIEKEIQSRTSNNRVRA